MDLLRGNIKDTYVKYLVASFGSAILPSVYGLIDMMVVGQYHGPVGSAAMAIIAPIWNVVFGCGILTGVGASIYFNIEKNSKNQDKANMYFTVGMILTSLLALSLWLGLIFFDDSILMAFGADETLLPLAKKYVLPVKFLLPVFLFMQYMAAFLRNDDNPILASKAVIIGGVFNIFGDLFFVFVLDMGIMGAGLATCMGASLSLMVMLTHFRNEKNTIKFTKSLEIISKMKNIISMGFGAFFVDLSMGILTMVFNIQIMKYLGSDALSVYGIIVNISTFVQCCAYAIGQSSQPILSANFSEGNFDRISKLYRYNVITALIISAIWMSLTMLVPNMFVNVFMTPTQEVLEIAPNIIRLYSLSYILLPFNIYVTYYFQSIMKPDVAFLVSILRGLVVSCILLVVLPLIFGGNSLWVAMLITEIIIFLFIMYIKNKK